MNTQPPNKLLKALRVMDKTFTFRDAEVKDAAFILSLRTEVDKSRHLSVASGKLAKQEIWLEGYADDKAYFKIDYHNEPICTERCYDRQGESIAGDGGYLRAADQAMRLWSRR